MEKNVHIGTMKNEPTLQNLSDFDTFQILKGITDNAGINVNLRLMMDAKDIQDFSSSFSTEAAKLYDSNRGLSNQYSTLAKSIVETMPDELSGELRDAKKYWLENIGWIILKVIIM